MRKKLKCVFIEPAPYIVSMSKHLVDLPDYEVEVSYLSRAISQDWESLEYGKARFISSSAWPLGVAIYLWRFLWRPPSVLVVAGWARLTIILLIILAKIRRCRVVCLTDTWKSNNSYAKHWIKYVAFWMIDGFVTAGRRQAVHLSRWGSTKGKVFLGRMAPDTDSIMAYRASVSRRELTRKIRAELGIEENSLFCLCVGRLEPIKGIDRLVDMFCREMYKSGCDLVIVGSGSLYGSLESAIGGCSHVHLVGRKASHSLLDYYIAADLLVGYSVDEAWGLAVAEALACGTPVLIGSNYGCVGDLVVDGWNGFVFDELCPEDLTRLLREFNSYKYRLEAARHNATASIAGWNSQDWASNIGRAVSNVSRR